MELPTYTNIWKIEKRLYKLYDFRLPVPVPVGQAATFLAIAVPYMLILTLVGMPFSHTWAWLYLLPPGALAWLVTRPVLEGKRLPELVLSQLRYLTEPRTWCRLAPVAEQNQILIVGRVWRAPARPVLASPASKASPASPASKASQAGADGTDAAEALAKPLAQPAATNSAVAPARPAAVGPTPAVRPVVTVRAEAAAVRPLRVVERALRTSTGCRSDRVVAVPGGHRPGKPDHVQRDLARARQPMAGAARIVVLGTTAGAGQTFATLLTGQLLASLRAEAVAVLDLGGRPGALTELARQVPRLLPRTPVAGQQATGESAPSVDRGLQVVTADHTGPGPRDADRLIDAVAARYPITLADPAAADVPRAVQAANQLVLVTPPGVHAASSLAMTLEWLEAHGHARLAAAAVTVLNAVSQRTERHAERAAKVAAGWCRAVVRVPWDDSLAAGGPLGLVTVHAYIALAGLLVSGLADSVPAGPSGAGPTGAGSASP